jgi:hypothetical protein
MTPPARKSPMPNFLKLTDRYDVAQNPANNLVLALAFAGVGLLNGLMPLMLSGLAQAMRF